MFDQLSIPVLVAPMAGGPSTPDLVSGAAEAGGFGFLAGGYLTAEALREQINATKASAGDRYGVNLFVPGENSTVDTTGYRELIRATADRYQTEPGEPRWDDDGYPDKLEVVLAERVPVVSFTFGLPAASEVARLHDAGSFVVCTVTTPAEARAAAEVGADALCVQGFEAGGHRAVFVDDGHSPGGGQLYGLLAALRLIRAQTELPLIAAGGLAHGADVAAVLTSGAVAAQLGTAFLRCPEAGTAPTQRAALAAGGRPTEFTRAFSGRPARGLRNDFMTAHEAAAPPAYPQLHWMTRPVRAAAGAAGDPEAMSLWAGQAYQLGEDAPVGAVLRGLHEQARAALRAAADRLLP
ncbi:nitroalkane oxidase [Tamaricihabitans halophyticus]|uniref:Propionate 3-nitronate monooxygenase n=1 Tax=Tamaricihabitans halophyticus TaxID=1262583 RepID=A0A4R2R5L4_9PSEU|nr:nitronate monooxygenase [Tamaricihabitans halophyticus]TCP54871.1 nitroalkane oxidase [Tamaricihabitans halophyticus]